MGRGARLVLWRYFFAPSHMKDTLFEKHYVCSDTASTGNLKTLSDARKQLQVQFKTAVTYPMDVQTIKDAEKYLSYLHPLVEQLTANDLRGVKVSKPPSFTWSGVLCNKEEMPFFSLPHHQFEYTMLLLNIGYLRCNAAADLFEMSQTEVPSEEALKQAAAYLCQAAGVFAFVADSPACRLTNLPRERPSEIFGPVAKALSSICMAEAQQCAILKANAGGAMKPPLLQKMCVAVTELYDRALTTFKELEPVDLDGIAITLRKYCALKAQLYKALAYKYQGLILWDAEDYGTAVACLHNALGIIGSALSNIPLNGRAMERFAKEVSFEKTEIERQYHEKKKENESVYYATAKEVSTVVLPEGKTIFPLTPFQVEPKNDFGFKLVLRS